MKETNANFFHSSLQYTAPLQFEYRRQHGLHEVIKVCLFCASHFTSCLCRKHNPAFSCQEKHLDPTQRVRQQTAMRRVGGRVTDTHTYEIPTNIARSGNSLKTLHCLNTEFPSVSVLALLGEFVCSVRSFFFANRLDPKAAGVWEQFRVSLIKHGCMVKVSKIQSAGNEWEHGRMAGGPQRH